MKGTNSALPDIKPIEYRREQWNTVQYEENHLQAQPKTRTGSFSKVDQGKRIKISNTCKFHRFKDFNPAIL